MIGELVLPRNIPTAVTEAEGRKLAELAIGKVVLELGAQYGFSTVLMAQTAIRVHSVDWHQGDSMVGAGNGSTSLYTFYDFIRQYGVMDKVVIHVGRFEEVLHYFNRHLFDGVFVDGEHTRDSVLRDTQLAFSMVKPGGWLAFHDWNRNDGEFDVKDSLRTIPGLPERLHLTDHLAWCPEWP